MCRRSRVGKAVTDRDHAFDVPHLVGDVAAEDDGNPLIRCSWSTAASPGDHLPASAADWADGFTSIQAATSLGVPGSSRTAAWAASRTGRETR